MMKIDMLAKQKVPSMRLLRQYRERLMTQAALGKIMGSSANRVGYLEGFEDITVMRIMILQKYVKALGGRVVLQVELPEIEEK